MLFGDELMDFRREEPRGFFRKEVKCFLVCFERRLTSISEISELKEVVRFSCSFPFNVEVIRFNIVMRNTKLFMKEI